MSKRHEVTVKLWIEDTVLIYAKDKDKAKEKAFDMMEKLYKLTLLDQQLDYNLQITDIEEY